MYFISRASDHIYKTQTRNLLILMGNSVIHLSVQYIAMYAIQTICMCIGNRARFFFCDTHTHTLSIHLIQMDFLMFAFAQLKKTKEQPFIMSVFFLFCIILLLVVVFENAHF